MYLLNVTANAIERRFNDNPSSYHSININRFCAREKKSFAKMAQKSVDIEHRTTIWMDTQSKCMCDVHRVMWRASKCPCKQHHDRNDAINPIKIEINSKHLMRDVIHFFPGSQRIVFRSIICRCVWFGCNCR